MADERKSGMCAECQKRVVVFRKGANHILHLLLSLITVGLWIPIWILASISIGGWRCAECGSKRIGAVR